MPLPPPVRSSDLSIYNRDNPRQIRITARILEWTHSLQTDWGFTMEYSAETGTDQILRIVQANFPKQTTLEQGLEVELDRIKPDDADFDGVIEALEQYGTVRVLSEPNVVVMCSEDLIRQADTGKLDPAFFKKELGKHVFPIQMAKVSSSSRVPYEAVKPAGNVLAQVTEFKDTSIQLTVGVEKIVEDFVQLHLDTSVTDLSGFISVAVNEQGEPLLVPQTDTRRIKNTVLVRDRTMFITGILQSESRFERDQGIPWLAEIPLIGFFFKNHQRKESRQELLFLVRPEIVAN